jgi:hypothetical protein
MNGHNKHVDLEEPLKHTTSPTVNTVINGNVLAIHSPINGSQNRTSGLSPSSPTKPVSPTKLHIRKPAPVYNGTPTDPHVCYDDARDMHRLLSRATSAEECRLIFDMFLAKSGIKVEPADHSTSRSLPQPSALAVQITPADAPLEHSLVELLLGGTDPVSECGVHEQQTKNDGLQAQLVAPVEPASQSSHGDETADEDSSVPKNNVHSRDGRGVMVGSPKGDAH